MSQLRFELTKNDYLAPKKNPTDLHFVIKIDTHRVFLRRESDDMLMELPKRMINMVWQKVDPKVIEVLYEEANTISERTNVKPNNTGK